MFVRTVLKVCFIGSILMGCAGVQYKDEIQALDLVKSEKKEATVKVLADAEPWRSSGVIVKNGETYMITNNGRWRIGIPPCNWTDGSGAGGYNFPCMDLDIGKFVPQRSNFALIGKIGEDGEPFVVGNDFKLEAKKTGVLFLHINDTIVFDNAGSLDVTTALYKEEKTFQEKPTIFVAYPKNHDELAEETVDLIGYVTSDNRTEKFKIYVNNKPLELENLWTGRAVEYQGLRGFPLRLRIPLEMGRNKIELSVLDKAGYLVDHSVHVRQIKLDEPENTTTTQIATLSEPLPKRLPDIKIKRSDAEVDPNNFMAAIGDWVKQTAFADYNKGNSMYDQNRLERAAYYYAKAIKTSAFPQAYFNLGLTQKALNKKSAAKESFSKACQLKIEKACQML